MDAPRVLVAEDFVDVRSLYAEWLRDAGFEVIEAEDGLEAVARARELRPRALIMDLSMPKLDGWQAIRQIRELTLEPRPYVLAVSAHVGAYSRADAYEAGADDVVAKPIGPDVVCAIVRAALGVSAAPPALRR